MRQRQIVERTDGYGIALDKTRGSAVVADGQRRAARTLAERLNPDVRHDPVGVACLREPLGQDWVGLDIDQATVPDPAGGGETDETEIAADVDETVPRTKTALDQRSDFKLIKLPGNRGGALHPVIEIQQNREPVRLEAATDHPRQGALLERAPDEPRIGTRADPGRKNLE